MENNDKERIKTDIEREIMTEWENRWATTLKGQITHKYFPTIKYRMSLPFLDLDHYTVQFISGHGNFKEKLKSFSLVESDLCSCGIAESPEHILFHCTEYEEERNRLKNEIEE